MKRNINTSHSLQKNINTIQKSFHFNKELIIRVIGIPLKEEKKLRELAIVYLDTIVEKEAIQDHIIKPLLQKTCISFTQPIEELMNTVEISDVKVISSYNEVINGLVNGKTILLVDGCKYCIVADTSNWKDRSFAPPQSQRVLKGPQIGFTELAKNNISLIKRSLKNSNLVIEEQTIGKETNTSVSLVYLVDRVDKEILKELKIRIDDIELEAILDSSYIEESISKVQKTTFPTVLVTERPDVTVAHILEGKIGIVFDGSSNILIVPALFIQFLQSPEDYYEKPLLEWTRLYIE